MSFGYDCETDNMLYNVFDTVWADLRAARSQAVSIENMSKTRIAITTNLLTAAAVGLRDPTTLKFVALQGIGVPWKWKSPRSLAFEQDGWPLPK
jgi:hypothetical protein